MDVDGNFTTNYSDLSGKQTVKGEATSTATYVTNLSVVSGNAATVDASTSTVLLSSHFYRNNQSDLPSRINGKFNGYFLALEPGEDAHLKGKLNLYAVPHFSKDTIQFGIVNIDTKEINFGLTKSVYESKEEGLRVTKTVSFARQISDPFMHNIPAVTVYHQSSAYHDDRTAALVTGTFNDVISSFNSYTSLASAVRLSATYDGVGLGLPVSNTTIITDVHNGPSNINLVPTYISVAKDKTMWLALSSSSSVIQLSVERFPVLTVPSKRATITSIISVNENRLYNNTVFTGNRDIPQTDPDAGKRNVFESTLVDADVDGNVWVGFTNPVSGSIRRYKPASELSNSAALFQISPELYTLLINAMIASGQAADTVAAIDIIDNALAEVEEYYRDIISDIQGSASTLATIEFDYPEVVPMDMVTTNKAELWTVVENKKPLRNSILTAGAGQVSALSASGDTMTFDLIGVSVGNLATDQVIHLSGFEDSSVIGEADYVDGRYLVKGVNGRIVTVKPYLGKMNNIPTTLSGTNVHVFTHVDKAYRFSTTGSTVVNVSGLFSPGYCCTDREQNLWVAHDINTVTKITTAGELSTSYKIFDTTFANTYASAGATYAYTASADNLHIGGITFDTYNNMYVVNAYESKLYKIPLSTPTLSSSYTISDTVIAVGSRPVMPFGRHISRGDWNGFRWMNKFDNTTGISTLTGDVTFNIYSSAGRYAVAKINENFDPIDTIKSYRSQPMLVDNGKVLFDDLYGSIVGSISSKPTSLGRMTYEKIANFTDNISDIDTCNIKSLYSLCEMVDLNIANYNFDYSGGLDRMMNIICIPHKKLWGQRSKYQEDFETYGSVNAAYGKNLGDKIDTSTYYVTAGTPIVARQLFNNEYKLVNTMNASSGRHCAALPNGGWGKLTYYCADPNGPANAALGLKVDIDMTYSFIKAGTSVQYPLSSQWDSTAVTVEDQVDGSVSHAEFVTEIAEGFQEWSTAFRHHYPWINLTFTNLGTEPDTSIPSIASYTADTDLLANPRIGDMRIGMHPMLPLSANAGILAHGVGPNYPIDTMSYWGTIGGDVHFNSLKDWRLDRTPDSDDPNAMSIKTTFIHEIGHGLGLGHSLNTQSIMYAYARAASADNFWQHFPNGLSGSKLDLECIEFVYPPAVPIRPESTTSRYHIDSYNKAWGWGLGENVDSSNFARVILVSMNLYQIIATFLLRVLLIGKIHKQPSQRQ